jgi:tetratricopeptide (TPR) repeat protein
MNGIRASIFVLLLSLGYAQNSPVLRGRVESDSNFFGSDYTVELEDRAHPGPRQEVQVAHDGSFEFRNLASGQYNLRLMNRGDTVCEQFIDSAHAGGELTLRLPTHQSVRPGPATVSVRELQRPVPDKALRAFAAAPHYVDTGREADAVRKLQDALRIYPDYADARVNLGTELLRLGRHAEAIAEFEKALAGGPPSAMLLANLSYSLCTVGRVQDAERTARRAIEVDNSYGRAHYLLGSILSRSVKPGALHQAPEAAKQLRLGAGDVPQAHLTIAKMYLDEGDRLSAAEEVRLYLKCGHPKYRADAERWLAQILAN